MNKLARLSISWTTKRKIWIATDFFQLLDFKLLSLDARATAFGSEFRHSEWPPMKSPLELGQSKIERVRALQSFWKKTTLNLHWRSAICVRLLTSKKSLLLIDSMTDSQLSEQRTNLRPHYFELWRSSLSSRSGQLFRKELTFLHFARSKKFIEFNFLIQLVALI